MIVEAASDRSLELLEARQLQQLSAAALGGKHPAVMLLWPCLKEAPPAAKLVEPAAGHRAVLAPLEVVANGKKVRLGLRLNVTGCSTKAK